MARRRGLDDGAKDLATFFEQPAEASWTSWLPPILSADDAVPQLPEGKGTPAVKLEHFAKYLTSVGDSLEDFAHIGRQFDNRPMYPAPTSESNAHAQTMAEVSGLAQALEHVPLMFFQEDFNLDWPQLWQQLGPLDSQEQQQNAVEELLLHLVGSSLCRLCFVLISSLPAVAWLDVQTSLLNNRFGDFYSLIIFIDCRNWWTHI
jgi:hypothetical protein